MPASIYQPFVPFAGFAAYRCSSASRAWVIWQRNEARAMQQMPMSN